MHKLIARGVPISTDVQEEADRLCLEWGMPWKDLKVLSKIVALIGFDFFSTILVPRFLFLKRSLSFLLEVKTE